MRKVQAYGQNTPTFVLGWDRSLGDKLHYRNPIMLPGNLGGKRFADGGPFRGYISATLGHAAVALFCPQNWVGDK